MADMNILAFIAEIVKATAWPIVVLCIAWSFRRQLLTLIPSVELLEWRDFKLRFGKQVERVVEEAREALPADTIRLGYSKQDRVDALQLAKISPRAAILEAWAELELAACLALESRGVRTSDSDRRKSRKMAMLLRTHDLFSDLQLDVWNQLHALRNAAAHARDQKITLESAYEYVDMAAAFERLLSSKTLGTS